MVPAHISFPLLNASWVGLNSLHLRLICLAVVFLFFRFRKQTEKLSNKLRQTCDWVSHRSFQVLKEQMETGSKTKRNRRLVLLSFSLGFVLATLS